MEVSYQKRTTTQQILDNLPIEVKSVLTIALIDGPPDRTQLLKLRNEAEASLATLPESEHLAVLCKMAGLYLLELTIPSN